MALPKCIDRRRLPLTEGVFYCTNSNVLSPDNLVSEQICESCSYLNGSFNHAPSGSEGKRDRNSTIDLHAHSRHASHKCSPTPLDIVIAAHGLPALTLRCLKHLAMHCSVPYSVIYVDNGSGVGVVRMVRDYAKAAGIELTIIANDRNRHFTFAINQGLSISDGAHVLILNNDCFVGPGCIDRLVAHLKSDKQIAAVGPVTDDNGAQSIRDPIVRRKLQLEESVVKDCGLPVRCAERLTSPCASETASLAFFCALLRAEALGDVGFMDLSFESGLGADDDWCRRAINRGWQIRMAHDAFATHLHHATFNKLGLSRRHMQRAALRKLKKTQSHQSR